MLKNDTQFKFSLITPTHRIGPFFEELYDSLLSQNYSNWEWVLWLNGGLTIQEVPERIRKNAKVQIYEDTNTDNSFVGRHKNKAFNLGKGDILVEVDHDDILLPECLEELNKAFQDSSVGFAYSDDLKLHMEDKFTPYGARYGWTYEKVPWKDKQLFRMHSFQPSSRSMAFIWFAPDHVRAWRASVYQSIGGHSADLEVCDDHELLIKTYLCTKMLFIDKPLYVYRIHGKNTWLEKNKLVQDTTKKLFLENAFKLASREADLRGLLKIDLGGGINPKEGCITIDKQEGAITYDLDEGIPLGDNSVGVINASHIIEHLRDPLKTMREIHRVLADGGWAFIEVPSTDGRGAWQDPTHVSFWNENSFWYYTKKEKAKYIRNDTIRFQAFRNETVWWDDKIAVTHCWLCAIKSDLKRPGLTEI